MRDFLQDVVSHTHTLGNLPLLKVSATDSETSIESMSEDRTVILYAKTHEPINGLTGNFGMGNLNTLSYILKCNLYKENATISLIQEDRAGVKIPAGVHFKNESGDFENEYRFLSPQVIDLKLKMPNFSNVSWHVELTPSLASIQKFKYQAGTNPDDALFKTYTSQGNLIFSFGDVTTHTGSFVFESNISGKLRNTLAWPKTLVLSVLNLQGDKTIRISNDGALEITIDSGIIEYNYIFPAHSF